MYKMSLTYEVERLHFLNKSQLEFVLLTMSKEESKLLSPTINTFRCVFKFENHPHFGVYQF